MVSVCIVNWNTQEDLRRCLTSLPTAGSEHELEVIVVDNDSRDGSAHMVQTEFPSVHLIASKTNLGYAAGNNRAFAEAKGEWLLALNPDTILPDGCIDEAVQELIDHPKVGCVAPALIDPGPDGAIQRSVRGFPSFWGLVGMTLHLDRLVPKSPLGSYTLPSFDYKLQQFAPQPMGTFLLFRRAALQALGNEAESRPFDEDFPIFFNDVDLSWRLERAGWTTLYCPAIRVIHVGGASTRQVRPAMIWESHRSLVRYLRKNGTAGLKLALPFLSLLIYGGALIRAKGYHRGF